ncbi:MAG TPA: hypothetical protein P5137_17370 [Candidatus Brocadiia bacterium]|nr:hypothetical protein [Candidatus Brocadiia bacterium]
MSEEAKMMMGRMAPLRKMRKIERLALIKERYRALIIDPRRQLEMELDRGYEDDHAESEHEFDADLEGVLMDSVDDDDA